MLKIPLVAILLLFAVTAFCIPMVLAADKLEYKLQPSDVLNITVHNQADLTTKTRVSKDGSITFPLLGSVNVSGLTIHELEQKLKKSLEANYLVNAEPVVFIEEYHSKQVSVIGEVNNPGKYEMSKEKETTLLEAIAMAGGFTKHANIDATKVIRVKNGGKESIMVKVRDIINKGDASKDIVLEPGDVVAVPEPKQVSVMGEVNNPGKYEMAKEKEMTLIEAIAMAGGFTKDADANKTKIIRVKNGREEIIIVAAKDIVDKGQKDKDIILEPDDLVSVPESFF
jgi:polysaccharide export outer membrane protein